MNYYLVLFRRPSTNSFIQRLILADDPSILTQDNFLAPGWLFCSYATMSNQEGYKAYMQLADFPDYIYR